MTVSALVSGGKDSVYSAYLAESQGWPVDELVTLAPADPESMMFHTPNLHLVALQAEAWGKRHRTVSVLERGERAEESVLETALRDASGGPVVAGAIASAYQFTRLLRIADRVGRRVFAPLWGKDGAQVVREEVAAGLDIRFVHLAAEGLPEEWLGQRLDGAVLATLASQAGARRSIHPAGEGGEFETLVVDAPFFTRRIVLDSVERRRSGSALGLVVTRAHLEPKGPTTGFGRRH
jgi:ABC transporter with metal-binding/Fe-S-binding domain ATP-binding protein